MKLSTKIILPIIIISALLILLNGCFGTVPDDSPDDSPGYTPGSITGRIMVPIDCTECQTSDCIPKSNSEVPSHWVPVEDAIVTVIPHATLTDENGYYTLSNIEPGVYYVITATFGTLVLKDIVEPPGVEEGKTYDAGTANCESTALGLIVEALFDMGLDSEDIEASLEIIKENPKFDDLVNIICCIIEDCDNVTLICGVDELIQELIDDEPGFTPEVQSIIVKPDPIALCIGQSKTLRVTAYYDYEPSVDVGFSDCSYTLNPSGIASITGNQISGVEEGKASLTVTYEGKSDSVDITVVDCACIPELDSLTVVLGNTTPMTLCNGATQTINSSHIASIIAHYTCEAAEVVLGLNDCTYTSEDENIASVSGRNVTGNDLGSTNIVVSYTDGGKTVSATQKVAVEVVDCTTLENITVDPDPMILCLTDTGTPDSGTIVTTAHYSDGTSAVVTPDLYDGYDAGIVSVDANGNVSSVGLGTTTITVHFEGETADVTVTVSDCAVTTTLLSISVDPDQMILCLTGTGLPDSGTIVTTAHYSDATSAVVTPDFYDGYSGIISVNATTGVVSSLAVGSTTITVHYEDKTATVDVTVNDCTPPCESTKLEYFSLEIKESSSWNEYLGGFTPNVTTYSVMATKNASHFRFTVDAECEGDATLYYNWYRGAQCGDNWLTGESGYSGPPSTWIPITSGGTYPTNTSDRSVCNKGGNRLFIKVTNAGNTEIYKVYVDRPNP
jgi:hypothetical protein